MHLPLACISAVYMRELGGIEVLEGGDKTSISLAEMCHFVGVMARLISRPVVVIKGLK